MEAVYAAYNDRLQELINDFSKLLEEMPPAALDWSPGQELNSVAVLAAHVAGGTRFWLSDVVAGEPSHRVRETEFQTSGVDAQVLRQRFSALASYVLQVLSKLTLNDLGQERFAPNRNRHYTVAHCLILATTHVAEHLGHAQMTRQLWEQQGKGA